MAEPGSTGILNSAMKTIFPDAIVWADVSEEVIKKLVATNKNRRAQSKLKIIET